MFTLRGDLAAATLLAIDNGDAVKIEPACFVDGSEEQYYIDFYEVEHRIVRCEYSRHSSSTVLEEVTGEDLELFRDIYHLH